MIETKVNILKNISKSIKNIVWGLVYQIIIILFGLVLPRMFILNYGSEVNGLLSSVNQIYTYVALLEAGVGGASLQALYKTIAKNDNIATSRVLAATDYFYKRTGILYLICVIFLSIIYPFAVKSNINNVVVSLIILFNGLSGVINYFFQGKYRILLQADGKSYVLSNASTIVYLTSSIVKIIILTSGLNVVIMQFSYFLVNLLQMIFILVYIKKNYTWINLKQSPDFKAISQKNSVLVHQIASLVFNNTDVIILSMASGLKTVSVYTIYNSFFNMAKSILYSFLDGVKFFLGQTYFENKDKFLVYQDAFETYYMALTFAIYNILYIFILPFLTIYTRGVSDAQYIDSGLALLFALIFLLQGARGPAALIIDIAGHFKNTRNRAIIEMAINIVVSLTLVWKLGVYGLLIGTIAALLYRANDIIIYVNKKILFRSIWYTYKRWGTNFILFLIISWMTHKFSLYENTYGGLIAKALPISIVIIVLYLFVNSLFNRKSFNFIYELFRKKLAIRK